MAGPTSSRTRTDDPAARWAASGAAALSGPPPGGRLGPPSRLVAQLLSIGERLVSTATGWGHPLDVDWLALLGERAALDGLVARGRSSCGGAARLMRCADGWVAISLARPSDTELLPAWLALAGDPDPWRAPRPPTMAPPADRWLAPEATWGALATHVRGRSGAALSSAAGVVGLPAGVLGERGAAPDGGVELHVVEPARPDISPPRRVLDLSTLWAGPLCASLLAACGAEVVKVSSRHRPDGAAAGNPTWYRLLNDDKHHVELALDTTTGREELARLVATADVVVESARPRGLEQMGIIATEVMASHDGPRAWVSITGHGRASSRVAFGDDAAVAGGLVVHDGEGPWFCADAVADPLSGITAADAAMQCLATGRRALVEVSMSGVAAAHAGPTLPASGTVRPPRARLGTTAAAGDRP